MKKSAFKWTKITPNRALQEIPEGKLVLLLMTSSVVCSSAAIRTTDTHMKWCATQNKLEAATLELITHYALLEDALPAEVPDDHGPASNISKALRDERTKLLLGGANAHPQDPLQPVPVHGTFMDAEAQWMVEQAIRMWVGDIHTDATFEELVQDVETMRKEAVKCIQERRQAS